MTQPAQQLEQHLRRGLGDVIYGMDDAIHHLALALVSGGHVLVQGVPGLGKTLLAKSFSALLGGNFRRIQCTADLMPSDITGVHIYRAEKGEFELVPGPVFSDVLLVDEINRTGPKTQSALLQAMEEGRVTIDRSTYELSPDFMVIASQNPADFEGTYPLPESQIDRFLLRLDLGYPDSATEQQVLMAYDRPGGGHQKQAAFEPLPEGLLGQAREQAAQVHVSEAVYRYATAIAAASRAHPRIALGLSTRGALSLMRCARVEAAIAGDEYITPDHLKTVAPAVVSHRLVLTPDAALEGLNPSDLAVRLLEQVEVPRE
jgi:MoxR-like ATPase